jgi:hypothetical protein
VSLLLQLFEDGPAPAPTPLRRSPLVFPACGSCPTPTSYDKDITKIWPAGVPRTRDYLRANCWGIPIAGLPWVPGITSSKHPERFLSYIFANYPTWAQNQWLDATLARGYTHVVFSWPNARAQAGQTLAQFRADCQRAKDRGFYVHVKLWSKDFDPHDLSFAGWQMFVNPIFDGLAGVVDEYSPWEYDAGNLSDDTAVAVHRYLGQRAHAQGASFWCHFFPGHGFWWEGHSESDWWTALGSDVDGLDLQTDPASDVGDTQARTVDHLRDTPHHKVRMFEPGTPTRMFDGDHPNEDEADAFGYLTTCVVGAAPTWGYGAGSRLPNGDPQ